MKTDEQKRLINLPDRQFTRYCSENFGLNRGVYNTIDEWFFKHNVKSIHDRRTQVLHFLHFYKDSFYVEKNSKLKFGKGNLIKSLTEFMDQQNILA